MSVRRTLVTLTALATGVLVSITGLHAQQSGSALSGSRDAIRAARFALTIDGVEIASFSTFDSLVDQTTGAVSQAISLTGGQTYSPELAAWHETVLMGNIVAARKSCSIVMYNYDGSPISTYNLKQAWPTKYTGASINGHRLATEGVVLIYEGLEIVPER